jgi:transposase-like protein
LIDFAVDLYVRIGASLRIIAQKIWKFFKTKVSHETIRQWVKDIKIPSPEIASSGVWSVDETTIRIKKQWYWLWIVMDYQSRQIISWHLSKDRMITDARTVIQKAKQKMNKPSVIYTDGLWSYQKAIKKEYGWRQNPHKRTMNAAFGPNSRIERLNREVKRRVKWFSTFQSLDGAKTFIEQWINQYNTEKLT